MNILATCAGLALVFAPIALPIAPTPAAVSVPDPGFTEAFFSNAVLNDLLSDRGCVGVRFYNAKLSEEPGPGTLMAVGFKADGSDLNGGIFAEPYMANVGGAGDAAAVRGLSRSDAAEACGAITRSGAISFSASMTSADLRAVLGFQDCTAVLVRPGAGGVGLRIDPGKVDGGQVVPLDPSGASARAMGDPCPAMCGPKGNYINEAELPK